MEPTSHKKKWRIITIVAAVLALLLAGGYITYSFLSKPANTKNNYQFIFDNTKAHGWWAAANFRPTMDDYTGDQMKEEDLNVVGRTIFQGANEQDTSGNCFVMFSYFDQQIDVAQKLKEKEKSITFNDASLSLNKVSVETLEMSTPEGIKPYQLHNYDIVGNNGSDFMRGTGVGYVTLSDGYLFINSVCKEASQLEGVTPAIQATKFTI